MTVGADEDGKTDRRPSLGGVYARLEANEKATEKIERTVSDLDRKFDERFDNLSRAIASQIDGLRSKGTNWIGVGGVALTAVGVLVVLAGSILSPINSSLVDTKNALQRIDERFALREDVHDGFAKVASRIDKYDVRLEEMVTEREHTEFKTRLDQRDALEHETLLRDMAAIDQRVAQIEGNLIKRPEISALMENISNRVDALSRNQEDMRRDLGSAYGIGDELKALRTQMQELSNRQVQELLNRVSGWSATPPSAPH